MSKNPRKNNLGARKVAITLRRDDPPTRLPSCFAADLKRKGGVYLAVLMASLLVSTLAMAALSSASYFARDLNSDGDYRTAQIAADAALEWAISSINADPNWRVNRTHNVDAPAKQLGSATIRYRLLDTDGNLANNATDPCDVLVTASVGKTSYSWRASLQPSGPALNSLSYAMSAVNNIEPQALAMWSTDHAVATKTNVTVASGASLTANCFATGSCSGSIYGSINSFPGTLDIPPVSVLDQYTALGTTISFSLLPSFFGTRYLDKQLLSATSNSINGVLNANGIYVIDCGGGNIQISNSRLACTLVLKNAGSSSRVVDSVYWEASKPNYPALLVQGDCDFYMTRTPLKEASVGMNLNPAGTPFRGQTDSNTTTVYPSQIRGLIYVSNRVNASLFVGKTDIFGVVLAGEKIRGSADMFVHYRNLFSLDPPPGFRYFSPVRIAAGSLRRVAVP